jgi:hypothetical protein
MLKTTKKGQQLLTFLCRGQIVQKDWSTKQNKNQYEVFGVYTLEGVTLNISELPVQTWTQNYKDFIEENLVDAPEPKGMKHSFVVCLVSKKMFLFLQFVFLCVCDFEFEWKNKKGSLFFGLQGISHRHKH